MYESTMGRVGSCAIAAVLLAAPAWAPVARADEEKDAANLAEALSSGKFSVALRYRLETVSDDAPAVADRDARASTLRTTLSYRSGRYAGLRLFVEFEDVSDVGLGNKHNNAGAGALGNGVTDRPVIADPNSTEVNQAYLAYEALPDTVIAVGRQEFSYAEQRFLGPVGWRQNHQTFDAIRVTQKSLPNTTIEYAFLHNANRIFGDDRGMRSHLANARIRIGNAGNLTPYVYLLDYDDPASAGLSTATYGLRWQGSFAPARGWTIPYHAEYAQQKDAGDNPNNVDADYVRLEVTAKRKQWWVRAGYELLGGEPGKGAFSTPLATLHKWNGWADKFLGTPPNGLKDAYLGGGLSRGALSALVVYHDFRADTGGADYGTELDAQVTWKAPWKQVFGFAVARYDADQHAFDTNKAFAWTGYRF